MDNLLMTKIKEYIASHPDAAARAVSALDEDEAETLPLQDLFAVLDVSGDESLEFEEFVGLFDMLVCCPDSVYLSHFAVLLENGA
jgi:hypothetical protein